MEEKTDNSPPIPEAATPVIKKRRTISVVWVVPLVALLIGGWLAYKALTEKGPTITISFKSAEGLEAGKTKIKYKYVELGKVTAIDLSKDFSHVTVTAEMVPEAKEYLTDKTRFWVVRARVTASQVTGLSTLFSGAYIGVEPGLGGKTQRHFTGLEKEPIVTGETKGRKFTLSGSRLGSLNPGSPIYFRQIEVGQVMDYQLADDGKNVNIQIFINTPYYHFVRENSRFWLASGLDLDLTANGLRVDTESVVSLLIGGLAFTTFSHEDPGPEAKEDTRFNLYETYENARDDRYTVKEPFIIEFKDSVRGLSIGAPVEFRGLQIGQVTDIEMQTNYAKMDFTVSVRILLEPERLSLYTPVEKEKKLERWQRLIDKGLRAQLETGSLLTGQLYIKLEFFEDEPSAELRYNKGLPVIPSVPSTSQEIMRNVTRFVRKLEQLPLESIARHLQHTMAGMDRLVNGSDLQNSLQSLQKILAGLETTTQTLNADTVPQVNDALAEMKMVLKDLGGWTSADAPLQGELRSTLAELRDAARAVSELADLLDRHPEALIQGKGSEKQ
jgi:paraquat-inducible protein B